MFGRFFKLAACLALAWPGWLSAQTNAVDLDWSVAGPAYAHFPLTIDPGYRTEALGPFYFSQESDTEKQFGVPPLFNYAADPSVEFQEFSFVYPGLTYRIYGEEYRFQILQLFSFAGGQTQEEEQRHRFTLFPFYFQQRSTNPKDNYTAVVPFYGHLVNRLFRDDIRFVMFPFYSKTRKKDVVTENYVYPIVHRRHGNELKGWQVWPFVGSEHKDVTYRTNIVDEREVIGGHDRFFVLWPFYLKEKLGIGTENPEDRFALIPFYSRQISPKRTSATYGWPFGYTVTEDREAKYVEKDIVWPLFVSARGEGKYIKRIFPFYSHARSATKQSDWYMWPVYKFNRIHSDPLDRTRTRIFFFLYSDIREKNTEVGTEFRRVDFWPFYTFRRDPSGNQRLQVLSILEPFFPNNRTMPREYGPVYTLWREEKNGKTSAITRSLLWNLYRSVQMDQAKKVSLFFGLFQYQSGPEARSWRAFYLPAVRTPANPAAKL